MAVLDADTLLHDAHGCAEAHLGRRGVGHNHEQRRLVHGHVPAGVRAQEGVVLGCHAQVLRAGKKEGGGGGGLERRIKFWLSAVLFSTNSNSPRLNRHTYTERPHTQYAAEGMPVMHIYIYAQQNMYPHVAMSELHIYVHIYLYHI